MLSLLKTYIVVYELNSFSKAAKTAYLSQPAISNQMKNLEAMIGGKLFYRQNNRNIKPTEIGEIFYEKSKKLINDWENIIELAKKSN